jgi:hypothetical protein
MGALIANTVPCAKGVLCFCLDEVSKGPRARDRLTKLRDTIAALAPSYAGLTETFDQYLVLHVYPDTEQRKRIARHLSDCWFGGDSGKPFFPGVPVSRIYAEGVLKTLELALQGKRVVSINAWWVLDCDPFRMVNLAEVKDGVTVSDNVTLLIMTPRPPRSGRAGPPILGDVAEAHVTERKGRSVTTRRIRDA